MADYEIIDLRDMRTDEYRPTEPELWAQMVAGVIDPATYQIRACRLLRWPGYARIELSRESPSQ